MSVLEKIRSRAGLLVGIVGVALLVFILQSAFESGNLFLGGSDNVVGEIAGKTIDFKTFDAKVKEATEIRKRQMGEGTLDQAMIDEIAQQVWSQMINENVMEEEYKKLGISVSKEELYDIMVDHPHEALVRQLTDPQSGKVVPRFADPLTGMLSPQKLKEFNDNMKEEEEKDWSQLEEYITRVRISEKYNNLIKKGLYVTTSEAKIAFNNQSKSSTIRYVIKNYKTVADSTVKVTDDEIQQYYNQHQNEFKQEATRTIEYISYDIFPSDEDIDGIKKDMEKLVDEFKREKSVSEDSSFVISEADSRMFDLTYHTPGTLSPEIDTVMFKAEKGTVVGPYNENGVFKLSKLINTKISADSAKVRHILIAYKGAERAAENITRSKEEAKKMADSLLGQIKKGTKFTEYVEKYSDDSGKKMPPNKKEGEDYPGKGGDYGWLNPQSGFAEPFTNFGLDSKKGDIKVVETTFGYHIIEVLDTKGSVKKVQVATIDKKVEASAKTLQLVYAKASEFAGKYNTNELFQKAVIDEKLNKRIAEKVKESDKTVQGIPDSRSLIK